jgi:hypothetical protein
VGGGKINSQFLMIVRISGGTIKRLKTLSKMILPYSKENGIEILQVTDCVWRDKKIELDSNLLDDGKESFYDCLI